MIEEKHLISREKSLLEALKQINSIGGSGPLVLFVLDDNERMIGTLTDGDSRRALISGASVHDKIEKVMQKNFNYMMVEDIDDVKEIKRQKEMKMKLVPVLNTDRHIVDIINLEKYKTRLPIDAVLMAGGKGERLRPLTEKTPKPLLPVGGKAIIDHNVDRLILYGVNHISVTVNYLKEQLEDHYREPHLDVKVKTVREPKFLGTIGSVKFLLKECILQWLRCYYILGDDKKNNSIFCKLLLAAEEGKKTFPFTTGKNQYDFITVDELANQLSAAVLQKEVVGIINCCTGKPMSLADRVEQFINEHNLDIKLEYGAFPDRPYDSPCEYGNNSKIQIILNKQ